MDNNTAEEPREPTSFDGNEIQDASRALMDLISNHLQAEGFLTSEHVAKNAIIQATVSGMLMSVALASNEKMEKLGHQTNENTVNNRNTLLMMYTHGLTAARMSLEEMGPSIELG